MAAILSSTGHALFTAMITSNPFFFVIRYLSSFCFFFLKPPNFGFSFSHGGLPDRVEDVSLSAICLGTDFPVVPSSRSFPGSVCFPLYPNFAKNPSSSDGTAPLKAWFGVASAAASRSSAHLFQIILRCSFRPLTLPLFRFRSAPPFFAPFFIGFTPPFSLAS